MNNTLTSRLVPLLFKYIFVTGTIFLGALVFKFVPWKNSFISLFMDLLTADMGDWALPECAKPTIFPDRPTIDVFFDAIFGLDWLFGLAAGFIQVSVFFELCKQPKQKSENNRPALHMQDAKRFLYIVTPFVGFFLFQACPTGILLFLAYLFDNFHLVSISFLLGAYFTIHTTDIETK